MARPPSNPRYQSEVDDIGGTPPGTPASSQPAAASGGADDEPTGTVMSQADLEARFKEVGPGGDGSKLESGTQTRYRTAPNPVGDPMSPNYQAGQPRTIRVPYVVQTWRNTKTGAYIEATHQPDGSFLVIKDTGGTKNAPATSQNGNTVPPGGSRNIEGTPDPSNPAGSDNERPIMVIRDKDGNFVSSSPLTPTQKKSWDEDRQKSRNPGGLTDAQIRQKGIDDQNAATHASTEARANSAEQRAQSAEQRARRVEPVKMADGTYVQPVYDDKTGQIIRYDPVAGQPDINKPPPPGLDFQVDDTQPDGGLAAYDQKLKDAWRANQISKQMALDLLQRAGSLYEARSTVQGKQRDQAITQRGQTLGEVQSRRSSANQQFQDVNGTVGKLGASLIPSATSGQTVVDAYRAMLHMAQDNVTAAGGNQDVPQVATPALAGGGGGASGADSTQVVMHPGGAITVSPVGSPVPGASPPADSAPGGVPHPSPVGINQATGEPTGLPDTPVNPAAGQPGNDPTKPVGLFNPDDHANILAELGLTPDEQANVLALYKRGVRSDHL